MDQVKGLPWGYIAERVYNVGDGLCHCQYKIDANILHGIMGGWTMRSEIINALLLREVVNQMTTLEKWIGYEEEGSLIPRGGETLDRIEGHEL